MHEPQPTADATVDLSLRVPRGTSGGLVDGVVAVLERIEPVREASVLGVDDMKPSPADLYVSASVRVVVDAGSAPTVRETLADGFGVTDVRSVALAEEGRTR